MTHYQTMAEPDLRKEIALLQAIQKTHAPASKAWQTASELLAPLFAEMARRGAQ